MIYTNTVCTTETSIYLRTFLDQFYYVSIYKTHFIIHRSFPRHMNKTSWLNVYLHRLHLLLNSKSIINLTVFTHIRLNQNIVLTTNGTHEKILKYSQLHLSQL